MPLYSPQGIGSTAICFFSNQGNVLLKNKTHASHIKDSSTTIEHKPHRSHVSGWQRPNEPIPKKKAGKSLFIIQKQMF